jgi:hypothetical protein
VQALGHPVFGHQAVHHDFDGVLLLLVEPDLVRVLEGDHDAVDAGAREPRLLRGVEDVAVLALPLLHEGREEEELGARGQVHDLVHDLLRGLLGHGAAAVVAGQPPDASPEDAQVVVDLRDRADGRAGVAAGRLLLDGDGGGEAADGVVERLVHLPEELPGIGVEALDVAALPFRVERVEGQGRLAGAGHAREDHQLLLGDLHGDVLEVVLACASDDDAIEFHRLGGFLGRRTRAANLLFYSPPWPRSKTLGHDVARAGASLVTVGRRAILLESPKAGPGQAQRRSSWHRDPGASFSSCFRSRWGRRASRPRPIPCPSEPSCP